MLHDRVRVPFLDAPSMSLITRRQQSESLFTPALWPFHRQVTDSRDPILRLMRGACRPSATVIPMVMVRPPIVVAQSMPRVPSARIAPTRLPVLPRRAVSSLPQYEGCQCCLIRLCLVGSAGVWRSTLALSPFYCLRFLHWGTLLERARSGASLSHREWRWSDCGCHSRPATFGRAAHSGWQSGTHWQAPLPVAAA